MKKYFLIPLFVLSCMQVFSSIPLSPNSTVNPVLGDASFIAHFGTTPSPEVDEVTRIRIHLEFVEDLLRNRDVSNLPFELQNARESLLDLLKLYCNAGEFPKNYDYEGQRVPCFIDRSGAICAVGYLVEQTAGREVAEMISSKFQYEKLMSMNDRSLDQWIMNSGLTREECAMIQPTYNWDPEPDPEPEARISSSYAITSSVVSGINVSMSALNAIQLGGNPNNRVAPVVGMITGAGQVLLGSLTYSEKPTVEGSTDPNIPQNTLSLVNIGMGTTTFILSAWNMFSNRERKQKKTSIGLYSFPADGNQTGFAFYLTTKF